ncbi:MAG TPA: glycosyltransferase [Phycicoccus sp.]|nr:glycosyltransferase [Phycicoccus sp.]
MSSDTTPSITFASNNGEVGGGEVMLIRMADAARQAGWRTMILGPRGTGGVIDRARREGHDVTDLAAGRRAYMRELRVWRHAHPGLLWCNGLVPALATAGQSDRVIHFHRLPRGVHRPAATLARRRAITTVVPSRFMAEHVHGADILENWTDEPAGSFVRDRRRSTDKSTRQPTAGLRIGYLGRWAHEKGVDLLLAAASSLGPESISEVLLAGEERFGDADTTSSIREAMARSRVSVREVGWVAAPEIFAQVDVVVVPSRAPESFGLVAAEAMAHGLPVVVTDAGGLPEVVGPQHPWIARPDDADDLARTLGSVAAARPQDLADTAMAGHQRWRDRYSPEAGTARMTEFLETLRPLSERTSR